MSITYRSAENNDWELVGWSLFCSAHPFFSTVQHGITQWTEACQQTTTVCMVPLRTLRSTHYTLQEFDLTASAPCRLPMTGCRPAGRQRKSGVHWGTLLIMGLPVSPSGWWGVLDHILRIIPSWSQPRGQWGVCHCSHAHAQCHARPLRHREELTRPDLRASSRQHAHLVSGLTECLGDIEMMVSTLIHQSMACEGLSVLPR